MATLDPNTTSALEAPAGQHSNLDNPYSLQRYLVATCAICMTFAIVSIVARTFVKAYILRKVQWEDCKFLSAII